jgi:hypothetical protein
MREQKFCTIAIIHHQQVLPLLIHVLSTQAQNTIIVAAQLKSLLGILHTSPRRLRLQLGLPLFRDRTGNPFQFQRERSKIHRTIREANIVLVVVAAVILLWRGAIGPDRINVSIFDE